MTSSTVFHSTDESAASNGPHSRHAMQIDHAINPRPSGTEWLIRRARCVLMVFLPYAVLQEFLDENLVHVSPFDSCLTLSGANDPKDHFTRLPVTRKTMDDLLRRMTEIGGNEQEETEDTERLRSARSISETPAELPFAGGTSRIAAISRPGGTSQSFKRWACAEGVARPRSQQ